MKLTRGQLSDIYNVLRMTRNIYDDSRDETQEIWDYVGDTIILMGRDVDTVIDDKQFEDIKDTVEHIYNKYDCWTKSSCYKRLVCVLRNNINNL